MNLVRDPPVLFTKELQISLMDKSGSLQCVVGPLPAQVARGNPVKLIIKRRQEVV